MAIQKIFRSAMPSFKYIFRNGAAAIFLSGRYTTDQKDLEDELMEEVGNIGQGKSKNPFIYVDADEPTLDTEALSPLELIKLNAKEEARKELLAEMAANQARANDAKANVSSTSANFAASVNTTAKLEESMGVAADVKAVPAEGVAARIAALKAKS